jgi:type II secretory pathway pseudopilin PulG
VVLFLVAITAAALAALGQAWSTAAQRERERELAFRGGEIARALLSYQSSPAAPGQFPAALEDLLEDRRSPVPRRHLRRLYADPLTGQADWVLVPEPSQPGRFSAVRSRSTRPLLRTTAPDGTPTPTAADWVFAARAYAGGPPSAAMPASAASMPQPASAGIP